MVLVCKWRVIILVYDENSKDTLINIRYLIAGT